tara:strand:- start:253 stop:393 length:141 start_codon:yes stop_codon:yes gene_type:complete
MSIIGAGLGTLAGVRLKARLSIHRASPGDAMISIALMSAVAREKPT